MWNGCFHSKEVSDSYIWDVAKLPAASPNRMELKEKKQLILLLNTIKHYVFLLKMCSENHYKNIEISLPV